MSTKHLNFCRIWTRLKICIDVCQSSNFNGIKQIRHEKTFKILHENNMKITEINNCLYEDICGFHCEQKWFCKGLDYVWFFWQVGVGGYFALSFIIYIYKTDVCAHAIYAPLHLSTDFDEIMHTYCKFTIWIAGTKEWSANLKIYYGNKNKVGTDGFMFFFQWHQRELSSTTCIGIRTRTAVPIFETDNYYNFER